MDNELPIEDTTADERANWTIKGVPVHIRQKAVHAAAKRGEHMWQWLARMVEMQLSIEANDALLPANQPEKPALTEDQRTVRLQAVAAMLQGMAALRQATGRALGRRMVAQEIKALEHAQEPPAAVRTPPVRMVR
jgi:hypothetical protein